LRIEGIQAPDRNIERLPCYTGINNEKAIGKLDKSRRCSDFTKRFGKNLAKREIDLAQNPVTH
jgi:hypothetical protein